MMNIDKNHIKINKFLIEYQNCNFPPNYHFETD